MARKYKSPDRFIMPDPRFSHVLVSKFINCIMLDGKKQHQCFLDTIVHNTELRLAELNTLLADMGIDSGPSDAPEQPAIIAEEQAFLKALVINP